MALAGAELWRFQPELTASFDAANAVAADTDGIFFLGGCTDGSMSGFVNAGGFDWVVAKVSGVDGSVLWYWQDGAAGDDCLSSVAATDDGGVVVGGYSNGTYNGVASEGLVDFAAIKLDTDGTMEWTWQEGTVEDDFINSCSKTTDGNVVLTGATPGDWDGIGLGGANIVAVKLDATDGTVIWRYQESVSVNSVVSFASAAKKDGSIVLAGWTSGDWFGEVAGETDFAAVALDEDGVELWRWQAGQALGANAVSGVTSLADGSVVLAGQTDGDFTGTNSYEGGTDFAVVKLTADGETEWTWQAGTESDEGFYGAETGIDGTSFILVGWTQGSWVETMAGSANYSDFSGMSMAADGSVLWTYQDGTTGSNIFRDVAVRPADGAALLVGWTHDDFVDGTTNTRSDIAGVLIETGAEASTPAPTASPASGLACGATVSFQVTSVDLPVAEGCYQATEASYSTGDAFEVWSVSGTLEFGEVVVVGFTDDGTGEFDDSPWNLSFVPEDGDPTGYCLSEELSATVHPADATWTCDLDGTGSLVPVTDASFSVACGCGGDGPSASPAPVSTPAPIAEGGSDRTPAPIAEGGSDRSVDANESGGGSSSFPLAAVIGGSVAGAVLLAILVAIGVKYNRDKKSDSSFGASPPGPTDHPVVWRRDGGDGASGASGAGAVDTAPPPPAYSEPPPPHADPAHPGDAPPPPPAYSEPPPYNG